MFCASAPVFVFETLGAFALDVNLLVSALVLVEESFTVRPDLATGCALPP